MKREAKTDDPFKLYPPPILQSHHKILISILDRRVEKLSFYNRWNIPFLSDRKTAVYLQVPRSTGITINVIFSQYYNLVQAVDNVGLLQEHETNEELLVLPNNRGRYLNMNMGTIEGIKRAKKLKLATFADF